MMRQECTLPVFMYHRIATLLFSEDTAGLAVSPDQFECQMRYMHDRGFHCLSLKEVVNHWRSRTNSRLGKAFVLTFDDGFEDFYTTAWPILARYGFTATIFPVVGSIGRRSAWHGQDGTQAAQLMSWEQLGELARSGIDVGSHTLTHPRLSTLDPAQAADELRHSKQELEDRLGQAVTLFSYPYSDRSTLVQRLADESGYHAACSDDRGRWGLFNIWRIQCGRDDRAEVFALKVAGWYGRMTWLREETPLGRLLRRGVQRLKHLPSRPAPSPGET
ncbi:MAG: polysaccharide deacetylase family protein [Chloroflexi bacterium]|nr:polysaccharide deacetylase family protein [Chloroflexota bacterium]